MGWELEVLLTFDPPLSRIEAQQLRAIMSDIGEIESREEQWVVKPIRERAFELTSMVAARFEGRSCSYQGQLTVN
jgi:hypothetical protein